MNYNAQSGHLVRQFKGSAPINYSTDLSCPSGDCQKTGLTYDGYGRLLTKHIPVQDLNVVTTWTYNLSDHRFDRSYGLDQVGRLTAAFSGAEARNEPPTSDRPYRLTYSYDQFGHLSQRTGKVWWTSDYEISETYANNRKVAWNWNY